MYILKRVGDRTEPYGIPACISLGVDISPSAETLNFRCERKEPISLIKLVENYNFDNLYSRPVCRGVKGFFDVQEHRSQDILLLKLRVTWSVSLIPCSVVLCRARKPNWPALSRHLSSMCFWTIFRMTLE
jgi:hypothetical protein